MNFTWQLDGCRRASKPLRRQKAADRLRTAEIDAHGGGFFAGAGSGSVPGGGGATALTPPPVSGEVTRLGSGGGAPRHLE